MFSGLTKLQHLELPVYGAEQAAVGPAGYVADLTTSSQLTCLNIEGLLAQQHYRRIFPDGRQLPRLRKLQATMGLLGTTVDVVAMVRCCPNLEQLDVGTGEGVPPSGFLLGMCICPVWQMDK
jgi:hypothetical protein